MKKNVLFFPLLVTLSAFAVLYIRAASIVAPTELIRSLLASILLICALTPLMNLLVKDWELTGIFMGVLAMALFYTIEVIEALGGVLLLVLVLWCGYVFLLRRPKQLQSLANLFSVLTALFLIAELVTLVRRFEVLRTAAYFPRLPATPDITLRVKATKPDIYYIIVDGYGRADILRDYYSFDNSGFVKYLQSKGFVVAPQARSNYPKTVLSIASELNLEYVDQLAPDLHDSPFWWTLDPYIDHSRLRGALEKLGYETYATASEMSFIDNETVDHYYKPYPLDLNEFEGFAWDLVLLGRLAAPIGPFASTRSYRSHAAFIETALSSLPVIAAKGGPKLVFVHIAAPHPPFVFDAQGRGLTPDYPFGFSDASEYPGSREQYRSLYLGQLQYLNGRLEQAIDGILANSSTPPIIVLQGDHGPGLMTDLNSAANTCIRERFSILAAIKMPGTDGSAIPPDVTAVNVFRVILNKYFDADLPLLPNASYFANQVDILHLTDVTDRLEQSCAAQTPP